MKIANKVAIVTGATQGIGLACAQHLAEEGSSVVLVDINLRRHAIPSRHAHHWDVEANRKKWPR